MDKRVESSGASLQLDDRVSVDAIHQREHLELAPDQRDHRRSGDNAVFELASTSEFVGVALPLVCVYVRTISFHAAASVIA